MAEGQTDGEALFSFGESRISSYFYTSGSPSLHNTTMPKEKKDKHFLKKAYYPGGLQAMKAFIKAQLRYPEEALTKGVEGDVQLMLFINRQGQVVQVRILKHLGHGCDEEAVRVAKLLKFNVPPQPGHLKTRLRFQKRLAIHFRLPKRQAKSSSSLTYTYTTSELKQTQIAKAAKSTRSKETEPPQTLPTFHYQYTTNPKSQTNSYFYKLPLSTEEE